MQELKININGFNTHLHHKNFKRQHKDIPGYSVYHVHCQCSNDAEDLKDVLCKVLLPKVPAIKKDLRERLEKHVEVIRNGKNYSISNIIIDLAICSSLFKT